MHGWRYELGVGWLPPGLDSAAEPTNADRAAWAENAVNAFSTQTYGGRTFTAEVVQQPEEGGDAYTMIQDLITDLLHLARRSGWEATEMLRRGRGNFDDEVWEEQRDQADAPNVVAD